MAALRCPSEPTDAPTNLRVSNVDSTSVTIHWNPVDPSSVMGEFKEYRVTHTRARTHTHMLRHAHTQAHAHAHVQTRTCSHTHTRRHTHMLRRTHTHTHTCTHANGNKYNVTYKLGQDFV